jgi:hypothetical protein
MGRQLLVPDHAGRRVADALLRDGHRVRVLPDRRWIALSDRVRVCSISDYNQDGVLLADVGGRLVVNVNDATDHGWRSFVRRETQRYPMTFHLQLVGLGDADMRNVFDESGQRLIADACRRTDDGLGASIAAVTRALGTRYFVPFSSMHRYQRTDSAWANELTTSLDDYRTADARGTEVLPAFVRYDCLRDTLDAIEPPARPQTLHAPEEFGDDWSETLAPGEVDEVRSYFGGIEHLREHFAAITVRVGGREHVVVNGCGGRGAPSITFDVPRGSLLQAVRWEVFDDLLIGNFMRTTLHGTANADALYPHFTPFVGKYADNGGARTREELHAYFAAYRRRAPLDYLRHRMEARSKDVVRRVAPAGSPAYAIARRGYQTLVGGRRRTPADRDSSVSISSWKAPGDGDARK